MFCNNCGKALDDSAKFCDACGAKARAATAAAPSQQVRQQVPQQPAPQWSTPAELPVKPKKKPPVWQILLIAFGVLLLLIIVAVASCSGGNNSRPSGYSGGYVDYDSDPDSSFDDFVVPAETPGVPAEIPSEEAAQTPEEIVLTEQIYGVWYSNIPGDTHTVTVQKDGKLVVTSEGESVYLNYYCSGENSIVSDVWEFVYSNETLLFFENGVQAQFCYVRTPVEAATPTEAPAAPVGSQDGAASVEELRLALAEYGVTQKQADYMTVAMKMIMVENAEEQLLSIIGDDDGYAQVVGDWVFASDLGAWFEQKRIEHNRPKWRFEITGYTEMPEKLQDIRQRCEKRTHLTAEVYKKSIDQLLAADRLWLAQGYMYTDDGMTGYLGTEGAMVVTLYILEIDGRYYWQIGEIIGQ